jgi:serine/threonine protein kinase
VAVDSPPSPQIVAGHYETDLSEPIGSGGMALVYLGRDLRTRRAVALKTLKPEWVEDAGARTRFRREARTMAFLSHPNVAKVYDLFEDDDDSQPWAVLEYINGPSLRNVLDRVGPFDIERACHFLNQIAEALGHLHSRGLVHLDVKPQNILFSDDYTVKLIDFGIAQQAGSVQEVMNGQAFGTVTYVSPEQASGGVIDVTSDVYSLGCVVYEMITGTPPFENPAGADPQEVLNAHVDGPPIPPTERRPDLDLPPWIDDIVLDAIEKDPARRYPSTAKFAASFRGAMEAEIPPDSTVPLHKLPPFREVTTISATPATMSKPLLRRKGPPIVTRIGTRFLWRLIGIFAIGNLLLAGLSYWENGRIPGLYDPAVAIRAGRSVRVTAELLNVRSAPSGDAQVIDQVPLGTELTVTGVIKGGWWPVRYERGDTEVTGYVAADHVEGLPQTGYEWFRTRLDGILP